MHHNLTYMNKDLRVSINKSCRLSHLVNLLWLTDELGINPVPNQNQIGGTVFFSSIKVCTGTVPNGIWVLYRPVLVT